MKKIYITSGVGRSGKDTFYEFISKYIPTYKYSIVDLSKQAAKVLGWDGGKTEKDRRFLSDIMDLSTDYNNAPFKWNFYVHFVGYNQDSAGYYLNEEKFTVINP